MTEFKFVHSSDLHLGKGFGTMPDDLRGRLKEARHEVIATLAHVAANAGARHILLAGDTFDTSGPSGDVRRQAATAMSAAETVNWWIIPGNHDSLAGEELWRLFEEETGDNVHVLSEAGPVEIENGVFLLPTPWPRQFPGVDLTEWMVGGETPEGALRIGLAHGGVTDFGEKFDASTVIPPDRAESARLDYLALGDWHGAVKIGKRTAFPGSPERDGFRHDGRGSCFVVSLGESGAVPDVETVDTGRFHWSTPELVLTQGMDVASELEALLVSDRAERRDVLVRIIARGFPTLAERGALEEAAEAAQDDFARFSLDTTDVTTAYQADDLDLIATGGALRAAAEALKVEADGQDVSAEDMRIAEAALNRLWALVREG